MNTQTIVTTEQAPEEWRDIPGYEGLYQVSDCGRVKRLPSGRILIQYPNENGYLRLTLSVYGKHSFARIHRLVLLAFVGAPPEGMVVNHKNGVRSDNRLENLEYLTQKENIHYSMNVLGTMPKAAQRIRKKKGPRGIDREIMEAISLEYRQGGVTQLQLATKYGVGAGTAHKAIHHFSI